MKTPRAQSIEIKKLECGLALVDAVFVQVCNFAVGCNDTKRKELLLCQVPLEVGGSCFIEKRTDFCEDLFGDALGHPFWDMELDIVREHHCKNGKG